MPSGAEELRKMLKVSVVIPTKDRPELLKNCLESIQGQGVDSMEIIVVDDCSGDSRSRSIARNMGAVYLRQDFPQGPGQARNRGIERASGYVVAFIDDDCQASRNWLSAGLALFDDGTVGGVEGRTEPKTKEGITPFAHYIENITGGHYQTCNMFYRRDVLLNLGGFDPRFPVFREDSELAFRLLESGFLLPFEPEALVYHPPRTGSYARPIKQSTWHHYDPLLCARHPQYYRAEGSFAIARSHYGAYLGYAIMLTGICGGWWWLSVLGVIPWLATQIYLPVKMCLGKKVSFKDGLMAFLVNLLIPPVRLVAVITGWFRFGKIVW
jgi:glycosyltransferase involved in cell wall biosynthesis